MSREDDWPGCYPEGGNNNKKNPKFPPSSILAGYEDAIWRALAHVNPKNSTERSIRMEMIRASKYQLEKLLKK